MLQQVGKLEKKERLKIGKQNLKTLSFPFKGAVVRFRGKHLFTKCS